MEEADLAEVHALNSLAPESRTNWGARGSPSGPNNKLHYLVLCYPFLGHIGTPKLGRIVRSSG